MSAKTSGTVGPTSPRWSTSTAAEIAKALTSILKSIEVIVSKLWQKYISIINYYYSITVNFPVLFTYTVFISTL